MDRGWWEVYHRQVAAEFAGERVTIAKLRPPMGVTVLPTAGARGFKHYNNSGAGAIALAALRGAQTIILLGYDCQKTGGRAHWHGDHPKTLGNAGGIAKWAASFAELAKAMQAAGVRVVNCSRETALSCFERASLPETLEAS